MKTVMVTTDFSANSKKAIRFAMQLAFQNNWKLVFYHVTIIMNRPSTWDDVYYGQYESDEIQRNEHKLKKFISKIHQETNLPKINYTCVCKADSIIGGLRASIHIMNYAKETMVDYICLSTRGAGNIDKLFGTVASELITKSPIPVFVIPKNYRLKPINTICYASDMENIDKEINKVVEFATTLKSKVKVLHYDYTPYLKINKDKLSDLAQKYESEDMMFHYKKLNPQYPLNYHIRKDVILIKPSLMILFTKQNRKWFDRLFLGSNSTNMSFNTKVPLLIYRKENK